MILPTGKHITTVEESVTLDNGGFTALELNSRHLNAKSSFLKKNGTRWGFIWSTINNISDYGQIKTTITVLYRETDNMHQHQLLESNFWSSEKSQTFIYLYSVTFIFFLSVTSETSWNLLWKCINFITIYFTFLL